VTERAGVLNLGVEGMMIVGAACGFGGAWLSGSIIIGALCGIVAGVLMSLIFAADDAGARGQPGRHRACLTILGIGLSGLIGARFVGEKITPAPHLHPRADRYPAGRTNSLRRRCLRVSLAGARDRRLVLPLQDAVRLILRAAGDNHTSAHALGYPVLKIRMLAVMFGGGCAGLAGAYLPLAYTPSSFPA
jgi:Uncharacterized ABC-type transport system, permease component